MAWRAERAGFCHEGVEGVIVMEEGNTIREEGIEDFET